MPEYDTVIPMRSLHAKSAEVTARLQLDFFTRELQRQALLAARAIERAWTGAMRQSANGRDEIDAIWADLQAMLFSGIIIDRILNPNLDQARRRGKFTRAQMRDAAQERAEALRLALRVPDYLDLFDSVRGVRDSIEHIDERMDYLTASGVISVSDWYVAYGLTLQSLDESHDARGVRFRTFAAPIGVLYFDNAHLDVFALHQSLAWLDHRVRQLDAVPRPSGDGWNSFGGLQAMHVPNDDGTRMRRFLQVCALAGRPLDLRGIADDLPPA